MGDHQRGAVGHQCFKGLTHRLLVYGIKMGRRFIQDQHGRIFQKRPGDGNTLALPARKPHAPFADHGLKPFGKPRHQFTQGCPLKCCGKFFFGRLRPGDQDIGAQGVVEKKSILCDERNLSAKVIKTVIAKIMPAESNGPLLRIPKTHEEVRDGGLAGTGRPHEGNRLARLRLKGGGIERLAVAGFISEIHLVQHNRDTAALAGNRHAGAVGDRHGLMLDGVKPAG